MAKPFTVGTTINSGKFFEMGIPDHLTCLLRNLYAGQEATVRTGHETTDLFQTGKGVHQSCILSPCLFNLYAEYNMQNSGLDEAKAGIKIAGSNMKSVNPKGNQPWIFIGRTDVEAETPILWPPDVKNWLIWKEAEAGKDWRWEEKGLTKDEMVEWHHRLNRHESEQAPGVGDEQGSLVCCSPWGHKESDTTELLNWMTDWQL